MRASGWSYKALFGLMQLYTRFYSFLRTYMALIEQHLLGIYGVISKHTDLKTCFRLQKYRIHWFLQDSARLKKMNDLSKTLVRAYSDSTINDSIIA